MKEVEKKEWIKGYREELEQKIKKIIKKELDIYICNKCAGDNPCLFIDFVDAPPTACPYKGMSLNEPEWRTP